jgi:hypothetical protein
MTPPASAPTVTHTPPSPPVAPYPKRQRASPVTTVGPSSVLSQTGTAHAVEEHQGGNNPTIAGLPFVIQDPQIVTTTQSIRPPEPATRKIEVDKKHDENEDEEMGGNA